MKPVTLCAGARPRPRVEARRRDRRRRRRRAATAAQAGPVIDAARPACPSRASRPAAGRGSTSRCEVPRRHTDRHRREPRARRTDEADDLPRGRRRMLQRDDVRDEPVPLRREHVQRAVRRRPSRRRASSRAPTRSNAVTDWNMVYVPVLHGRRARRQRAEPDRARISRASNSSSATRTSASTSRVSCRRSPARRSVLLTGQSAGGFGAALNYVHVARAFGSAATSISSTTPARSCRTRTSRRASSRASRRSSA